LSIYIFKKIFPFIHFTLETANCANEFAIASEPFAHARGASIAEEAKMAFHRFIPLPGNGPNSADFSKIDN
jgi:hypothetical protein